MSTAAAAPPAATGGRKKLIVIAGAVVLLLLLAGGAAMLLLKKPSADDEDGDGAKPKAARKADAPTHGQAAYDPKHPPVFVALEPFTVNLADTDAERFAQIGVTLEIDDPKTGDTLKLFMPAVRNNILMVLSNKTAAQLLTLQGKERLAKAILNASVRPLGFQVDDEDDDDGDAAAEASPKKKTKKKRAGEAAYPVRAVHFSNFIVQ